VARSKTSNRREGHEVKVTLDLKTTERVSPGLRRLWQLLLSPRPDPNGKRERDNVESSSVEQDIEETGEDGEPSPE
jgi:hypothetical protein